GEPDRYRKAAMEPRQQQEDSDRHQKVAARRKLPEVEADLGNRPDDSSDEHRRIDPQGERAGAEQQYRRQQQRDSGDHIISAPAESDQRAAEHEQPQADDADDDREYRSGDIPPGSVGG